MKQFQISQEQMQTIATSLGECPSKYVISAIDILRNLPEISPAQSMENKNE